MVFRMVMEVGNKLIVNPPFLLNFLFFFLINN